MPKLKPTKKSPPSFAATLPALLAIGIILTSLGSLAAVTDSQKVQALCMVVSAIGVVLIGVVIGIALSGRSGK